MNSIAWSVSNHRHPASGNKTNHESMNPRSEEHTSELQSLRHLVCRLLLEKKKKTKKKKKNKKKKIKKKNKQIKLNKKKDNNNNKKHILQTTKQSYNTQSKTTHRSHTTETK